MFFGLRRHLALVALSMAFWSSGCRASRGVEAIFDSSSPRRLSEEGSRDLDVFPALSPDGNEIAYCSARTGRFEIYVRTLGRAHGGDSERAITSDGRQNLQPAWSPDGKTLAYHASEPGGIWLVPALGGAPKPLTDFGSRPAFSPDGRAIVFQSQQLMDLAATSAVAVPPSTIWAVPVRGGPSWDITRQGQPLGGHGSPFYTPDGTRICFVAQDPGLGTSALWSVSPDGTDLKELFTGARLLEPVVASDGETFFFGGAAEGSRFTILTFRVSPKTGARKAEPRPIVASAPTVFRNLSLSKDGRRLAWSALGSRGNLRSVPLAKDGRPAGPSRALTTMTWRETWPVFSPDGRHLAFGRIPEGGHEAIWTMNADGGHEVRLTKGPAKEYPQDWFPDGERLLAISDEGASSKAFSVHRTTSERTPLPFDITEWGHPRLSPDGSLVAYHSKRGGITWNVWLMPVNGHAPASPLTFDRELFGFPCWSPDGRTLAAEVKRGDDVHIATVPVAGGTPTQLTSERGLSWPFSFSPDGDRIAFAGLRQHVWNVFWVSRTSREVVKVTENESLGAYVRYPAWSPRGDRIVYEHGETTGALWMIEAPRQPVQ